MSLRVNGYVIWEGPSLIDGSPIVVIATGFLQPSANTKTGPMVQVWIMRSDMTPLEAVRSGEDYALCGDCVHRENAEGKRSCYVLIFQAPTNVYRTFMAGRYPPYPPRSLFKGANVRIGAYGDPAAVPVAVWADVCASAVSWTAYTHQWRTCDPTYREFCMASVDSEEEKYEAQALGYRTYRVKSQGSTVVHDDEIVCPATQYIGGFRRTNCQRCRLCDGVNTSAKNIVEFVHGPLAVNFKERLQ